MRLHKLLKIIQETAKREIMSGLGARRRENRETGKTSVFLAAGASTRLGGGDVSASSSFPQEGPETQGLFIFAVLLVWALSAPEQI